MNTQSIHYPFRLTKRIFLLFMSLLTILSSISGIVFYQHFRSESERSTNESLQLTMQNNVAIVNDFFGRIEALSQLIHSELPELEATLKSDDTSVFQQNIIYKKTHVKLCQYFSSILGNTNGYRGYWLANPDIPFYSILAKPYPERFSNSKLDITGPYFNILGNSNLSEADWYQQAVGNENKPYWFLFSDESSQIWLAQSLSGYFMQNGSVHYISLGVMIIGFDMSQIQGRIASSELTKNVQVLITDNESHTLYSSNRQDFLSISKKDHILLSEQLIQNLQLQILVPSVELQQPTKRIAQVILLNLCSIIIAGAFLSGFFTTLIVRPIRQLCLHMENTTDPAPIPCKRKKRDEITQLYNSFNELVDKINRLIQNVYESTQAQKEQKLKLLYAQINPHFLYNTLDSVCCIALTHGEAKIADALSALANILRYNIKNPDQLVCIDKEIEIIEDYITIQRLRCKDKLTFTVSVEPELETAYIPKMIIQPLVENCINYGVSSVSKDVSILVSIGYGISEAATDRNSILIKVQDEGKNSVDDINRHLTGEINISRRSGGLGIRNILERIQLVFGKEYGLTYEYNNGTCAVIRIPKLVDPKDTQLHPDYSSRQS